MGGRGSSSGLGGGAGAKEKPFRIPKITAAELKSMRRKDLERWASAIVANNWLERGVSLAEGLRRFEALKSSNSDAQLRKTIARYGKKYWKGK